MPKFTVAEGQSIHHDGKPYAAGEPIELSEAQAAALADRIVAAPVKGKPKPAPADAAPAAPAPADAAPAEAAETPAE